MKPLSPKATLILACATFGGIGLSMASIGPALPNLAANTGSTLTAVGAIFTALFLGAMASGATAGMLCDRLGFRPVWIAGVLLFATGLVGIILSRSLPLLVAAGLFGGLGLGTLGLSMNMLVVAVFPERSVAAVNLLNALHGVGAVLGPVAAGGTLKLWGSALPLLAVGATLLLVQIPWVMAMQSGPRTRAAQAQTAPRASLRQLFRSPLLWVIGLSLMMYVGSEQGTSGWITTYLTRSTGLGAATAALGTAAFWGSVTIGRLIAVWVGTRLSTVAMLRYSLLTGVVGGILLAVSTGNLWLTGCAVFIMGVAFGPVYGTTAALVAEVFPHAPGTAASVTMSLGSIGGMSLPFIQGVVLEQFGPRASVIQTAIGCVFVVLLHLTYSAMLRRRAWVQGAAVAQA